jgi:hypothetical protein
MNSFARSILNSLHYFWRAHFCSAFEKISTQLERAYFLDRNLESRLANSSQLDAVKLRDVLQRRSQVVQQLLAGRVADQSA